MLTCKSLILSVCCLLFWALFFFAKNRCLLFLGKESDEWNEYRLNQTSDAAAYETKTMSWKNGERLCRAEGKGRVEWTPSLKVGAFLHYMQSSDPVFQVIWKWDVFTSWEANIRLKYKMQWRWLQCKAYLTAPQTHTHSQTDAVLSLSHVIMPPLWSGPVVAWPITKLLEWLTGLFILSPSLIIFLS